MAAEDDRIAGLLLDALDDSAAVGFAFVDPQMRFVRVNEALAAMQGVPAEEHVGRPVAELCAPLWPQLGPLLRRVADTRRPIVNRTINAQHPGTEEGWASWLASVHPVVEDGDLAGLLCLAFRAGPRPDGDAEHDLGDIQLLAQIRDAMHDDRLVLYSQPIVPLAGGPPREELLVRMLSLNGVLVPPCEFLPVAEEYGLIVKIDRWVIREAARLAGQGRRVEVNLSQKSIVDPTLFSWIEQELRAECADPANLTFELTETALLGDWEAGTLFARRLVELGCGLALDDFGTGFGSLTYLKALPLRGLKIDVEFVRDLAASETSQHLVRAIVNIAGGLGLETVAEGVEDEQTLALLRAYGVDYVQGFHLGRPAPLIMRPCTSPTNVACTSSGTASSRFSSRTAAGAGPTPG